MEKVRLTIRGITIAAFVILLVFVLYWRWQVSTTRFFDVDEFTHMNWAASVARGEKPYVDFFTFFTPGFYWVFSLLYKFNPPDPTIFLKARVLAYLIFIGNMVLTGALFALTRKKYYILLPMLLFAWLPMPFDKGIEIRPDNLSLFFSLAAFVLQTIALIKTTKYARWLWLGTGILYAASMLVLVKMVPFVFMGFVVIFFHPAIFSQFQRWFILIRKTMIKKAVSLEDVGKLLFSIWRDIWNGPAIPLLTFVGFGGVMVLFLFWLLTLGNFPLVWYSLTKLALESSNGASVGVMEPHLFFFPNSSFYGMGGLNASVISNHLIWFIGIIVGTIRLFTPFVTAKGDRKKALVEILFAGTFIISCVLYVQFYPLKHSQYLIPISIFIVFYAADFLSDCFTYLERKTFGIGVLLCLLIGGYYLVYTTLQVNAVKLTWSNTVQLQETAALLKMIPKNEKVFDVEGRTVFWKPAYYICCLPFGSYIDVLSRKPEPLVTALERGKTPYIFQGLTGRLPILSAEDLWYINTYYERVPGWGDQLWKRKQDLGSRI